ncbi:FAR1 [Candida theae]|uniref:FAR1 n=1 Tax=Candida theae TaxID=1198502 RepID=A0AAD5BCT7_9ASCO|nr:FAR1 [Candida theae]KAI5955966.1 FAR1 [Candida theae]
MSNKRSSLVDKLRNTSFRNVDPLLVSTELNGDKSTKAVTILKKNPKIEQAPSFEPSTLAQLVDLKKEKPLFGMSPTPQMDVFVGHLLEKPIKSSKRHNGQICCFCQDSIQLTLPGETIIPLSCEHLCHKNCFMMLIDPRNRKQLPICDICKASTNVVDEDVYLGAFGSTSTMTGIDNESSDDDDDDDDETDSTMDTPILSQNASAPLISTPTDQIINNQLHTPPTSARKVDCEPLLFSPIITCTSEMHPIKPFENNEVSYVLNIKPPPIYSNSSSQFNPSDLKLKWKVSHYVIERLSLNGELGELIAFDKMRISVDGEVWDESCIYLFSKFLLVYNDETLAGVVSISNDLCSVGMIDGVLNLNLTDSSLPELYLSNQFSQTITEKWEYVLQKVKENQQPNTNLFQFTSTCWLDLQYNVDVPSNLIRFNYLLVHGEELPSFYLAKILPPPHPLALNIVIAVPLFNKTNLSNADYLSRLQEFLHHIRSSLNDTDKMALIFLGVDHLHNPKASGTFIGCIEASWNGWDDIIKDMSIVANTFSNDAQELEVALEKCADLYPFIPCKDNSINKLLLLSCGEYDVVNERKHNLGIKRVPRMSLTLLRVGSHVDIFKEMSAVSKFEYGNEPVLRYATFDRLFLSIELLMKRIQSTCISHLEINFKTENNITISSIELFGKMKQMESQSQKISFNGIASSDERNFLITVKVQESNPELGKVPLFNYRATWGDNKSIEKTVIANIDQSRSPKLPIANGETRVAEPGSPEKSLPKSIYFLDIPLLPPLSPSRNAPYAKRQAELLIIQHLRQAIAEESPCALQACISVAYGLLKGISQGLGDDNKPHKMVLDSHNDNMLKLMAVTRAINLDNQRYVSFLVDQLGSIIDLFDIDTKEAVDKCFDLVYSLV